MADRDWQREFPDLPHEPQDLDLIRRHLAWTPAQRLANVRRVMRFVLRARAGRWRRATTETPRSSDDG